MCKYERYSCSTRTFFHRVYKAMFKEYNVDYVVMKDSGKEGGTLNKIKLVKN